MPRSVQSTQSAGSSGSRHANTRKYFTVNKNSSVDESLFGTPNAAAKNRRNDTKSAEPVLEMQPAQGQKKRTRSQKEVVQVITKDLIRDLIVPQEDPSGQSVVLPRGEYYRIINAARVLTQEERQAQEERRQREREAAQEASSDRKLQMQALDRSLKKNEKLNDLDEEARQKAEYLLQKAKEQQEEQEDEIKHLNEMTLNAKCHAIRDAQILEKQQIKEELVEEEKRLDIMMEVERKKALELQEEIEAMKKEKRYDGSAQVLTQIAQREEERLLNQERRDQEAHQMLKYLEKLQVEDLKELDRKQKMTLEAQKEITRANEEAEDQRVRRHEQEKLADLKVTEYMKKKAAREAEYEAEQERSRVEKEKEIAKLRAMQERAKDYMAEKDALRAKRNQEQREREWRQKEKEEAFKKAETELMLKIAREEQVLNKEHFLAVQAQRERHEFERVLKAQNEGMEKEQLEEKDQQKKRLSHADEVRKQIRQKEQITASDRHAFFEEGVRINEEARARRIKLDTIKQKKLAELRNAGVPEKYCKEVERRIEGPAVAPFK